MGDIDITLIISTILGSEKYVAIIFDDENNIVADNNPIANENKKTLSYSSVVTFWCRISAWLKPESTNIFAIRVKDTTIAITPKSSGTNILANVILNKSAKI